MATQRNANATRSLDNLAILMLLASFVWAFWPTLTELISLWKHNEDYSHGFIIVPAVAYLLWSKRSTELQADSPSFTIGLLVVVLGLLGEVIGIFSMFRSLANLSLVITIWGVFICLFGLPAFRASAWELFILVFMLPIPSNLYARITLPLQLLASRIAATALELLSIPVYRAGNVLTLPNTTLEVVNACSGLRSILTVIVLSFIMSSLSLNRYYKRFLLILFTIPVAVFTNVLRVTVLGAFAYYGHSEVIEGTGHTLLGLFLFVIDLAAILLITKGINRCFSEE